MIRVRNGDEESILTIDEFERRARQGDISPHALVSIPALTDNRFVEARELPLFVAAFDPRRMLFRRHFRLGRLPIVTGTVALVCIALYFFAADLGGGVVTREVLLLLGAKARARIVDEGESWRILAANLLHRDATHLAFNLFAFLNVGTVLEAVYRRGDYLLLLVTGAVATMTLSTLASWPLTVGASGMVFACLGAAVVFGLRFSDVLALRYRVYFSVVVVGYAAIMFYLGLRRATTDNWGHAGGLLAGLVVGGLLEPRLLRLKTAREPMRAVVLPWVQTAALCIVVVAVGPLLPRAFLRMEPYTLDAFGVSLSRPKTWARGADPLGMFAFGNGVDALAALACARLNRAGDLDGAVARFVSQELRAKSDAGQIADLSIGPPRSATFPSESGSVAAKRFDFSYVASEGRFEGTAVVASRGEIECALAIEHRGDVSQKARALLDDIVAGTRLVATRAQRLAMQAIEVRGRTPALLLELAIAHESAGDVAAARTAFDAAAELAVDEPGLFARVMIGRARFEIDQGGDLRAARTALLAVRALRPTDEDVLLLGIDLAFSDGDVAAVRAALLLARATLGDDPRVDEREARLIALDESRGVDGALPPGGPATRRGDR